MSVDHVSPTWMAVRFWCRNRMRELEREGMNQPDEAREQTARMRGEWAGLRRLLEELGEGAVKEGLDRPDLNEESFEP